MFPTHDPVLIFALVMVIVLVAPLVFERLRVPGIIGLIVTGMIVGPHALDILERDRTMELLGTVGLLYIMFVAGLEIDLNQFARQRSHSLVFGLLTFFIPLVAGFFMATYLLGMNLPSAILLASMFSSHTLVTYPIVSRLGLTKARSVTTAIGGTMITDTGALMVLAVIAASVKGSAGAWFWFQMLSWMVIYVATVYLFLPRLGHWFFRRMEADGATEYVFVLAIVFVCAWLARAAGLEPIIGAFLAGLTLNRLIPERSTLMNRIQFVGHALFIPFFLISVGMLINLRLMVTGLDVWVVSVAMTLCALLTKLGAAMGTRLILKYNRDEGLLIFGLSVNQAAATLAAVLVGYDLGLFNDAVLTGTIIMIMVSCMVGPWATELSARALALQEAQAPYNPADAPHRILVPLAHPASAPALMSLACFLRRRESTEPVYPLKVILEGPDAEAEVAAGEKLLGSAVTHAVSVNVPVIPVTRVDIHPESGILGAMRDYRISTVIAGWDGKRSSHQRVFGRVLDAVLEQSRQMLIVSKVIAPLNTTKRVILIVPPMVERHVGFQIGARAIKVLAGQIGARLCVVATSDTVEKAVSVLESIRPVVPVEVLRLETWKDLFAALTRDMREGDLMVLARVRKGRLAWQPMLDRLPGQFVRDFTGRDFLVVYLPESRLGGEYDLMDLADKPSTTGLFPAGAIRIDLDGISVEAAIRALLKRNFGPVLAVYERLVHGMSTIGRNEPVELTPGAVLIHTHTEDVAIPSVYVGVNRSGFSLPRMTQPPRVLFLLISPRAQSPEQHLQLLAMMARWMHRTDAVEGLCRATDEDELRRILTSDSPVATEAVPQV